MKKLYLLTAMLFVISSVDLIGQKSGSTQENNIPKYLLRNQYYNEVRDLNKPNAPKNYSAYRSKMYKLEKKRRIKKKSSVRTNSGYWESTGPSSFSNYGSIGRVNRLAFHPTDTDIIYAATASGGLWRTPNHGIDWFPMSDHIPNMSLSGVVVDQTSPDTIFILTGDGDGCCGGAKLYDLSKFSSGVLRTFNNGTTWEKTALEFNEEDEVRAYNLYVDPFESEDLFACTSEGIFKLLDRGDFEIKLLDANIFEMQFKPDDNLIAYAVSRNDFYKSTDGGNTWTLTATIPDFGTARKRLTIATCENDPDRVWLYAAPRADSLMLHRGLFLSDDAGESFVKVDSTSNLDGDPQGGYDLAVVCNHLDSDEVLIGKVRIYKSTNGGSTFFKSDTIHADQHQFIVNPLLPDRLYVANDGGVYYSDDFGDFDTWEYMSENLRITQYYKISVGTSNPNLVVAGSQDNGTHRNNDATSQFKRIHWGDGMDSAIHPSNDSLMIVSSQEGNFDISYDLGENVDHFYGEEDLPDDVLDGWVTPVAWDPTTPNNIYFGFKPIMGTYNLGVDFIQIADTVGGRSFLKVAPSAPSVLYACDGYTIGTDYEYHIHRSDNFGTSWDPIHLSLPDSILESKKSDLTINPDDETEIWLSIGGFLEDYKVFRSTDSGLTWSNETGSLPNIPVNCIEFQDSNGGASGAVYIGTDIGVYYRNDDLGDWIYFSNGLPSIEVSDIEIQFSSQKIFAGTYGRGVWASDLYSDCPDNYALDYTVIHPTQSYFFQASDSITINDYNMTSFGAELKLKAENLILIEDGFISTSDNNAFFKANLGPCGGGIEYKNPSKGIKD